MSFFDKGAPLIKSTMLPILFSFHSSVNSGKRSFGTNAFSLLVEDYFKHNNIKASNYKTMQLLAFLYFYLLEKLYKRGLVDTVFDNNDWNPIQLKNILIERKTYCEKNGSFEHATLSKEGVSAKTERYNRDFLVSNDHKKYKITRFNDLCYNPANLKFGVICLNKFGSAIFSPIYVTFEINKNFDPNFIGFLLTRNSFINKALKYQQGTVYERMAVSPDDLLNMEIQAPKFDEQNKISNNLNNLSSKVDCEVKILEKLVSLKNSLLQQMFI